MRISTNNIYDSGIDNIQNLQYKRTQLGEQLATLKRVNIPSDDPIASARILQLNHSKSLNEGFTDTRNSARTILEGYESSLANITNSVLNAQSSLIAAGNNTFSDSDRATLAIELKNARDTLLSLANGKDSNGNFLYSGGQNKTPAFNTSTTAFQGNQYTQQLQVDPSRLMNVSVSGTDVFQHNGNDIFVTLDNMITALNTPITNATIKANFDNTLATSITSMRSGLDQVLNVRAEIGGNLKELDNLDVSGENLDFQFKKSISVLEDLDYTKALSDFSKYTTALEAAQRTYTATTSLSLFNFIQ